MHQALPHEAVLDILPTPVFITDGTNHAVVYSNEALRRLIGKPNEIIDQSHFSTLLGIKPDSGICTKIQEQIENREVLSIDVFAEISEGRKEWIKFQLSRIEGLNRSLLIWTRDTFTKEAMSRPSFSVLNGSLLFELEDSPQPVFAINKQGKLFFANGRCCQLSGYSNEELLRRGFNILLNADQIEHATQELRTVLQGSYREVEVVVLPRTGVPRTWLVTAYPSKNEQGEAAAICFVQDLTQEITNRQSEDVVNGLLSFIHKDADLRSSLIQMLQATCVEIGADSGECWFPDYLRNKERLFAFHYPDDNSLKRFCDYSSTLEIPLEQTEDMRRNNARQQVINLFLEPKFMRRSMAVEAGIESALAIPVFSGNTHVSTLVFFSKTNFEDELQAVRLIRMLSNRLGVHIDSRRVAFEADRIFELVPDFLCILDRSGRIYKLNARFAAMLGRKSEEIIGTSFFNWVDDEYVESSLGAFQKLQSEQDVQFENIIKGENNKRVWLEWSLNANNTEGIIYAAGQDLTLRILYDEELRNQNERFRLLREAANEGIYDWDMRRDEYDWGDSFTKLTSHNTVGLVLNHEHWQSFIFNGDKERILNNQHAATLNKNKYWNEEYQYRCADGSYKHILDRGIFIYDEFGKAIRLIGTMQDITALKQSEESLIQLNEALQHRAQQLLGFNKELEQFAYIVSHDLQEPLRMISSFMQLLLNSKEISLSERSEQYIGFALDGANRMKRLIQDLLTYSRVGTTEEDFNELSLREMLRDTLVVYQQLIREKNAQVTVGNLPNVRGIRSLIQQILDNLLSNALKYNDKPQPAIHFDCIEESDQFVLKVSDNGIGIDSKSFDLIYLPFKRLHNKAEYSGTGIGLAVCKKIADKHRGQIWVESTPGVGSTFYFSMKK
jgi:PAS domain S-box-containing protein